MRVYVRLNIASSMVGFVHSFSIRMKAGLSFGVFVLVFQTSEPSVIPAPKDLVLGCMKELFICFLCKSECLLFNITFRNLQLQTIIF